MKTTRVFLIFALIMSSFISVNGFMSCNRNNFLFISTDFTNQKDILFSDYKLFMIYTRDSIMRKLLSTQIQDFCNFSTTGNKNKPVGLNWQIVINLHHEEIVDILTNLSEYGDYYNFLIKDGKKYFVADEYLNYNSIDSEISINIFPDFAKLDPYMQTKVVFRFGLDNDWNKDLDDQIISHMLSKKQIEAFQDWKNRIGFDKARKLTSKKITK